MLQGQRTVSDDTVDLIHRTLGVALPISEYAQKSAAPSGMPLAVTVDRDGEENIVCVEAKAKAKLEKEAKKARRTLTDHLNYLIETHPERGR